MPRTARLDAPGVLHHIMIRGIERRKIFMDDNDRDDFLSRLEKLIPVTGTSCFAWAFMPNHAHFLFRTGSAPIATLMRRIIIFMVLSMTSMMSTRDGIAGPYDPPKPKADEVAIHYSGVEVPVNSILLIRKDSHCCALKFTRVWTEKGEEEKYSAYEVYHQGDGSGDFTNKNVKMSEGRTSYLPLRGPFRPFIYQPGDSYVKCGPFKLTWRYKTTVGFMPTNKGMGDFGFEFAPTPWTDIKEVNIKDQRIKWYRYDEKRERVFIPIDKLWDKEMGDSAQGK